MAKFLKLLNQAQFQEKCRKVQICNFFSKGNPSFRGVVVITLVSSSRGPQFESGWGLNPLDTLPQHSVFYFNLTQTLYEVQTITKNVKCLKQLQRWNDDKYFNRFKKDLQTLQKIAKNFEGLQKIEKTAKDFEGLQCLSVYCSRLIVRLDF